MPFSIAAARSSARLLSLAAAAALAAPAFAKLPPPTPEAKAKAAEAAEKAAHTTKVDNYKLCTAMDRVAAHYFGARKAAGLPAAAPSASAAACTDPGPFVPKPPLEAAGAHSPPATAVAPPSSTTPAAAPKK